LQAENEQMAARIEELELSALQAEEDTATVDTFASALGLHSEGTHIICIVCSYAPFVMINKRMILMI